MRELGKLAPQCNGQDRHVVGGRVLAIARKSVGIDEPRRGHPQAPGRGIHFPDERFLCSRDSLGNRHGHIIGGFDHQVFERRIQREPFSRLEVHLARRLLGGMNGHGHGRLHRQLA